jgi:uncharacterized membrane protein (UPF0127 family)
MSNASSKVVVLSIIMLVIVGGISYLSYGSNDPIFFPKLPKEAYLPTVFVGNSPVKVYVADSIFEQQKGLSIFDTLPPSTGMFFIFDEDDEYGIWMKDMKFAIDIIWIDTEGNIVDMVEHATPESYPRVFVSKEPALYVLEVASGFVEQRNILPSDIVDFSRAL